LARPFRYTFIIALVALSTCLAAVGGWRYARASAPVNGPVILVSIDSLRADRLPAYGYAPGRTPAIDSLAADGVVFERAYSHVPQTLPAHAALLTGRLPFETGVRDSAGDVVPDSERLLAEMLSDRDFATGGVVSSYLLRAETGVDQGFDFFDAELPAHGDAYSLRRDGMESVRVAERWLASAGTTRAFLFVHVDDPRALGDAPDRLSDLAPYDARVTQADEAVGHLVRYLKTHQLYDQSTVILVADHGEGLGDHGEQRHGLFVYDETVRVPLIIKPAAGTGAGRRIQAPVQHIDLVPTILDLAKAPRPGNLRGRSLTPLFDGSESLPPAPIYAESMFGATHFTWAELTSVVDDGYRYIRAPREELYDLAADPDERENLATSKPDVAARLRATLGRFLRDADRTQGEPRSTPEKEVARYETLGYVGEPSVHFVGPREHVDPKDRWQLVEQYRRAIDLAASEEWNGAIEAFRALLKQEPLMIDAWLRLARVATLSERHDLAADAYKRVVQHEPANIEAQLAAAASLLRAKKYDEARQLAQRAGDAMDETPARSLAHELLARVALARRQYELARTEAELAENADPRRPVVAYVDGRIAFDEQRYLDAVERFDPLLTSVEDPKLPAIGDLRLHAAEALVHVGRLDDAEQLLQLELAAAPLNARARGGLAAVEAARKRVTTDAHRAH
jgi:arylsulfatase A-like enzyme/Tfp pilus assembly protein PilF